MASFSMKDINPMGMLISRRRKAQRKKAGAEASPAVIQEDSKAAAVVTEEDFTEELPSEDSLLEMETQEETPKKKGKK
jgi:hypothetical protein